MKRGLIFTTDIPAAALLFTAFILLIFSALLSSMEAAFSSCSILKITVKNDEGDKNAGRVLKLLNSFDSTLTGILVWINFVNITYETLITVAVASTRGSTATFLSAVVSAIIIAIAGEVIPKMCVTKNPEAFIMRSSVLLCSILKIAQPVTKAFYKTAEFFARSAIKEKSKNLEEDDIEDLTKEATKNGEIEKDTAKLVLEALDFDEKQVAKCMIAWKDVITLNEQDDAETIYKKIKDQPYSRLPVIDMNGNVKGILNVTLFLRRFLISGKDANVNNAITRAFFVKKEERIDDLLSLMSENKVHLAIVHEIDKKTNKRSYLGIITLEDILEELVGEIWDERDEVK